MELQKEAILITGARENNLRQVSLQIRKGALTVFTGLSGSGKSSLVLDTIAAEAARQLGETFPAYIRNRLPQYERPKVESIDGLTPTIVIDQRPLAGDVRSTVGTITDVAPILRILFSRCAEPSLGSSGCYSFNDPRGMCLHCGGLGKTAAFQMEKLWDGNKTLNQGAILFPGHQVGSYQWQLYANCGFLDPDKPLEQFSPDEWREFLHGAGKIVEIRNTTGKVWDKSYNLSYEGFLDRITRLYLKRDWSSQSKTNQKILRDFTWEQPCPDCRGGRLNQAAQESRLLGKTIVELGELELGQLLSFLRQLKDPVGGSIAQSAMRILRSMEDMGLGYLRLNRPTQSLSGGETQRLKLVRHLGSSLVGMTYVFDEPTTGLHTQDVERLNRLLLHLRDRGNTLLVISHHKDVIAMADQVVDMGPGAGEAGGRICFQGSVEELRKQKSATANYLNSPLPWNRQPRIASGYLYVTQAGLHNLKGFSLRIPTGVLTVVSGVAGSGKSSLACGELLRQHPEVLHISQAPVAANSRSTPATYVGAMDDIRRLFAAGSGRDISLFSHNAAGACPACGGKGEIKTELAFLEPVVTVCESCQGMRFCEETLQIRLNGRNILDVLRLSVDEAIRCFQKTGIARKLQPLSQVGMGYMTLGQPMTTLSGGECQRIKLASHLRERNAIYVMDEPTTGLHGADVALLLRLLQDLVDKGNTVIAVEHDPAMIAAADWVIDMGPGGGEKGGEILFSGTVKDLLQCQNSATAACLRRWETI